MSADKRNVSTDALATLGTLDLGNNPGRDAIHLAVDPVIAGETLHPGQHIGFINGRAYGSAEKKLGIVDPFIEGMIMEGEQFWMVVYPRKINSLRHVWEYQEYDEAKNQRGFVPSKEAEARLRAKCSALDWEGPSYEEMLALFGGKGEIEDAPEGYNGKRWVNEGEYLFAHGHDAHGEIPNKDEVFDDLERVIGKKIEQRPEYFSCSC